MQNKTRIIPTRPLFKKYTRQKITLVGENAEKLEPCALSIGTGYCGKLCGCP
jgi:hypothetical protein